jgi:ribosomal protein S20
MPKTKSAKKALRQSAGRRELNLSRKRKLNDSIKLYKRFIAQKKTEEAGKQLVQVYKTADKMAKVGFIKAGRADRIKSRLSRKLRSQ